MIRTSSSRRAFGSIQNWANEIMRQTGKSKPVCVALAGLSGVDTKNEILSTRGCSYSTLE